MTLGNLMVETQVGISTAWVDADKDRGCFDAVPALATLLPEIQAAHDDLIRIQVKSSANSEELKNLSESAQRLDNQHDNKGKGVYSYLEAVTLLADSPEDAESYRLTRDRLMPDGIKFVQRSYLDESGGVAGESPMISAGCSGRSPPPTALCPTKWTLGFRPERIWGMWNVAVFSFPKPETRRPFPARRSIRLAVGGIWWPRPCSKSSVYCRASTRRPAPELPNPLKQPRKKPITPRRRAAPKIASRRLPRQKRNRTKPTKMREAHQPRRPSERPSVMGAVFCNHL